MRSDHRRCAPESRVPETESACHPTELCQRGRGALCVHIGRYWLTRLRGIKLRGLSFGGGGFYFGGPVIGGSGIGLILVICLIVYFMGGFRTRS